MFLRALAVTFLIAFGSLWVQLDGLIGSRGILPAGSFLELIHRHLGGQAWWRAPTLCWLNASDAFLHGICGAGIGLAVLLLLDVAPAASAFGLWALYLSLVTVGQDFLSFQWDNLLLEAGLLAVFVAPLRLGPRHPAHDRPPPPLIVWLFQWLLFRLMFSSAVVKLASGDPTWRTLAALRFHYETQPLPTWLGWYAHQLPAWFGRLSCLMVFVIEGLVPFGIFAPRRCRQAAGAIMIGFQLLIAATGNYGFFNLLTIALCVWLFDDDAWPRRCRPIVDRAIEGQAGVEGPTAPRGWPGWIVVPFAAATLLVSTIELTGGLRLRIPWPAPMRSVYQLAAPLRSINSYGLFAVMTTERPEIIVEGSADGSAWRAYEFRYKPGDPAGRPRFVAPHQPRLDWQMWFAALDTYQEQPWFLRFCQRLLEGEPRVLALLKTNPFPGSPPRYVRATVYDYHFSDPALRRAQKVWWRRELKGRYCPTLSLRTTPGE